MLFHLNNSRSLGILDYVPMRVFNFSLQKLYDRVCNFDLVKIASVSCGLSRSVKPH